MHSISAGTDTIIALKRRTLATLPSPSWSVLGDRPPWQIISAAVLADILDFDHGLLAVWRQRRLGPPTLPSAWFKGHTNGFRLADIWRWLASRHGLPQPSDYELTSRYLREFGGLDDIFDEAPDCALRIARGMVRDARPVGVKLTVLGRAEHAEWAMLCLQ